MRERKIHLNDAIPLIEEKLAEGQEVFFSPDGISMLPTLQAGRDTVVLVAPTRRLKKYDIALFRRENGQYVLHRVIKCAKTYTFAGDNQLWYEKNIAQDQIVALCTAYIRNEKRVSFDSFSVRMQARGLHYRRFARKVYCGIKSRISALLKRK